MSIFAFGYTIPSLTNLSIMVTLQQYEYIVAVDKYRHFVEASKACFVTQPTLSMQIKKMEGAPSAIPVEGVKVAN